MMGDILKNVAQSPGSGGGNTSMIVPGALALSIFGMLTYHHATQESYEHAMAHFLAIIFLQMFPLILLKMKIYSCGDRLSLVPRTLVKTLLMHLVLGFFRIAPMFMKTRFKWWDLQFQFDLGCLIACFTILRQVFGCHFSLRTVIEEREVRNLIAMACLAAAGTEVGCLYIPLGWMSDSTKYYVMEGDLVDKIIFTAANYIDVVAFMPVVWTLYRAENDDDYSSGTQVPEEARKQVLLFFAFVCSFYAWDDVIDPIRSLSTEHSIAMMAHAAHFVLLLDFACFFIFQVWTPSSSKGEQLQGLLEAGLEQDD